MLDNSKSQTDQSSDSTVCSVAPLHSVWLIDGEDMIIARSERRMKAIYRDYHGESIKGHACLLINPDDDIPLTDGSDEEWSEKASDFALNGEQFVACYR